jgi:sugar (pentulose or hexulose) kinase
MTTEHLLAIDQGTQSVRALVFDLHGNIVGKSQVALKAYVAEHPGWAEQDPAYYWSALCQACHQLWQQPSVRKETLAGVALTCQRGTIVNVDRDGEPLRPAMIWLDQRRTLGLKPLGGIWGLLFKLVGLKETAAYIQAEAEANWIRTNQPDVWSRTHKYLMLSGYLTHRLVGRFVDSAGAQVGYVPFDYKKLRWAAGWDWKWRAIPMDRAVLPELVPPTGLLGEISNPAAEATGIPAGLPLVAAASDKACEALGAGCIVPHSACLSLGTSASVIVTAPKYREVQPLIPPYPAAFPHAYNLEAQIYRGFWMVEWFKQQFGQPEQEHVQHAGGHVESMFEELLREVPPGSQGLVLQPFWSPGLKVPGPEARGAIIGFRAGHTRAHIYRAILEGLAYALREGTERIEKRTRVPIRELRAVGGGSQSAAAVQLIADVFGRTVVRPHTFETSALGAAIDIAVGLRLYPDVPAAVAEMTRVGDTFEADQQTHALYEGLYDQVYRRIYPRLQSLYQSIHELEPQLQ